MMPHGVGRVGRMLVARLDPGQDVLPTLRRYLAQHDLRSGTIVSMIGSLRECSVVNISPKAFQGEVYCPPVVLAEPLEFLNGSGIVSLFDDSPLPVHVHVVMSRANHQIVSGHMTDEGNIVAFTVEVTVLEVTGIEIRRRIDPESGHKLLVVEPTERWLSAEEERAHERC